MKNSIYNENFEQELTNEAKTSQLMSNEEINCLLEVWGSRVDYTQQIFPKNHFFKDPLIRKLKPTEAFCYTLGICQYYF